MMMSDFLLPWLLLAAVNLMATMVPGPAFVMAVRSSVLHGRMAGILTSIGLGAGVAVHAGLSLIGIAAIMSQSVILFVIVKYLGAAYLIYIGVGLLKGNQKLEKVANDGAEHTPIAPFKAFRDGFLANLLNPKAVLFFSAIYAQFIDPHTPWAVKGVYGATSAVIEALWFSLVSVVLTTTYARQVYRRVLKWIERVCGVLLVGLGIKLAASKL